MHFSDAENHFLLRSFDIFHSLAFFSFLKQYVKPGPNVQLLTWLLENDTLFPYQDNSFICGKVEVLYAS